jgi:hypothetical protein
MGIRLIEGLHLTATNKRHLAEIIGKGWTFGQSKRIAYTVTPIEGHEGRFAYHWRKPETDDFGRRVVREGAASLK